MVTPFGENLDGQTIVSAIVVYIQLFSGSVQSDITSLLKQRKCFTNISDSSAAITFGVKLHCFVLFVLQCNALI